MTIANKICQSFQSYYLQNNTNAIFKAPIKLVIQLVMLNIDIERRLAEPKRNTK